LLPVPSWRSARRSGVEPGSRPRGQWSEHDTTWSTRRAPRSTGSTWPTRAARLVTIGFWESSSSAAGRGVEQMTATLSSRSPWRRSGGLETPCAPTGIWPAAALTRRILAKPPPPASAAHCWGLSMSLKTREPQGRLPAPPEPCCRIATASAYLSLGSASRLSVLEVMARLRYGPMESGPSEIEPATSCLLASACRPGLLDGAAPWRSRRKRTPT
jgi:hypothetical protein